MQRALLLLIVAASVVVFGGAYRWATAPLVGLAAAAFLLNPRAAFPFASPFRVLDSALVAGWLVLAVQLTPVPASWRDTLSPHAHAVASALRLDVRMAPAAPGPLSIDPAATEQALATLVAVSLVFWTARGAFTGGGVRLACRVIVVLGVVLALGGVLQRIVSPTRIYGFWTPQAVGARPFGPFVNRNHFAAWLLMAIPIAIGYLVAHVRIHVSPEAREPREFMEGIVRSWAPAIALAIFTMVAVLVITLSRSALAGLGAGLIAGWLIARPRLEGRARSVLVLAGAIVAAGLALLAVVDLDAIAARLEATLVARPVDRVVIWRETLRVVEDFWLTGVGGGAYGTAMLVYQQTQVRLPHLEDWVHFNQAHSHYLQVLTEGGLLLAIPAIVGLISLVRRGRHALLADRREIFWVRAGAAGALVGIATQSIWETALTMPAIAFLGAVAAALLVHRRQTDRRQSASDRRQTGGDPLATGERRQATIERRRPSGVRRRAPGDRY